MKVNLTPAIDKNKSFSLWRNEPFMAFFVCVCVVSILALAAGWNVSRFYRKLRRQGILTTAKVTHDEIRPGIRGKNHYFFYTYKDLKGVPHMAVTSMHVLPVGEEVEITYLSNDPSRHTLFRMSAERVYQPLRDAFLFAFAAITITLTGGKVMLRLAGLSGERSPTTTKEKNHDKKHN